MVTGIGKVPAVRPSPYMGASFVRCPFSEVVNNARVKRLSLWPAGCALLLRGLALFISARARGSPRFRSSGSGAAAASSCVGRLSALGASF
jgi:hypothetical protein